MNFDIFLLSNNNDQLYKKPADRLGWFASQQKTWTMVAFPFRPIYISLLCIIRPLCMAICNRNPEKVEVYNRINKKKIRTQRKLYNTHEVISLDIFALKDIVQ